MNFIFKVILILFYSMSALCWTPNDLKLYSSRHFIELGHLLVMQNKMSLLKKIQLQEHDLAGCRALNRGRGGIDSMILCIKFLNRESEMKIFTPGRGKLISDINVLCPTLLASPENLRHLIDSKVLDTSLNGLWRQCNDFAWRQVYLTVYANFEADPMAALTFVHKAQSNLTPNSFWSEKTLKIFSQNVVQK